MKSARDFVLRKAKIHKLHPPYLYLMSSSLVKENLSSYSYTLYTLSPIRYMFHPGQRKSSRFLATTYPLIHYPRDTLHASRAPAYSITLTNSSSPHPKKIKQILLSAFLLGVYPRCRLLCFSAGGSMRHDSSSTRHDSLLTTSPPNKPLPPSHTLYLYCLSRADAATPDNISGFPIPPKLTKC